ncbi:sugar transferase [Calothrix sp. NIES-4071]|nr:sugar transferase [Calothrix sp. NIES-4071]BAZ63464.1 sugar transferase [Calothrix sp. NIES-4105]
MTISTIPNLESSIIYKQDRAPYCTLTWRRGKLLVRPVGQLLPTYLPATDDKESLVECLRHSSVNLVLIDPELGFSKVKFWADATEAAHKSIYLSIPSIDTSKQNAFEWLQVIINSLIALVFLIVLSPVALWLVILTQIYSPGSLFTREWHVGKRGKLFQVIKFRTTTVNTNVINNFSYQNNFLRKVENNYTLIGKWLRKYALNNIPQLLNVLRGEMNLIGRQQSKLEDAVKLDKAGLRELNKTPGFWSSWQVAPSELLHLNNQTL